VTCIIDIVMGHMHAVYNVTSYSIRNLSDYFSSSKHSCYTIFQK